MEALEGVRLDGAGSAEQGGGVGGDGGVGESGGGLEGEAGVEAQAAASSAGRKRRRLGWIVAGFGIVAVVAIASAYLYFANVYMPLANNGFGPDSSAGSLFLREANGEFGARTTYVFCSAANGRFAVFLLISNNGSYPITLLGSDPGPGGLPTDHTNVNGFGLVDFAYYRVQPGNGMSDPTDPWLASVIPPTTIEPGGYTEVWARFRLGSMALTTGSEMSIDSIRLRFSTLGVTRTAEMPLGAEIAVTGDCRR